jgi:hypothetical protein
MICDTCGDQPANFEYEGTPFAGLCDLCAADEYEDQAADQAMEEYRYGQL